MRAASLILLAIIASSGVIPSRAAESAAVKILTVEIAPSSYNGPGPVFRKGHPARFQVTLDNPSGRPSEGVLCAEVVANLETRFDLPRTHLTLKPGRTAVTLAWDYPGTAVYEGPGGQSLRIPGPAWGLSLNVAWRESEGRDLDRGHLVFAIDRQDGTSSAMDDSVPREGSRRDFALRYSGYLSNHELRVTETPSDFRLTLTKGAVERWRRGPGPTGGDTCLAFLSKCPDQAEVVLEHASGNARLLRAWLLEPDRPGAPSAARLEHRSDLKSFRFQVPPHPSGGVLVLELGPSHHVPPVPLETLAKGAESKFGAFPDLRIDSDGKPIRDRDQWASEQLRLKRAILAALAVDGDRPKCPLEPRDVSEESVPPRFGPTGFTSPYLRRKISIQVRPGERMNVWLLIPPGVGPFPAVLACHQTVSEGKDEPIGLGGNVWQLDFGPHLVSRGFVVAAVDSPTFGERFDPLTESAQDTSKFEAAYPSWSLLARRFQDHARTLDYLGSLPLVARDRIGVIGHSLGGESAAVLAALDPRVRCSVISCGFTLLRTLEKAREVYCLKGHAILPSTFGPMLDAPVGSRRLPFDFDDLMKLWAPRPVFYHEVRDELPQFTSAPQTLQAALALRKVYELAGDPGSYHTVVSAQAHCFPKWVQADAFDWLSYWLAR